MPRSFLSKRASRAVGPVNAWARAVSSARASGSVPLDLSTSNPLRAFPDWDFAPVQHALHRVPLDRYEPSGLGSVAAREAIAAYLDHPAQSAVHGFVDRARGQHVAPSALMLTTSTSESYSFLFKLLADPGDRVLVPAPSYPLLEHLAAFEALEVVPYELGYDGAWYVDMDSFRRGLDRKPAAIIVVTPNNPTASLLSFEEFEVLRSYGIPLIVDQVFAPYCVERPEQRELPLGDGPGLVFALDGLSKRCGLPHVKLGWIAAFGPPRLVAEAMDALESIGDTYLGVNSLTEGAAGNILQHSGAMHSAICERLQTNSRTLRKVFSPDVPISVFHYEGGWSVMFRLPSHASDDEWALRLLESGVVVQPSWLYDCPSPATFVASLITPPHAFQQGLSRIAEAARCA